MFTFSITLECCTFVILTARQLQVEQLCKYKAVKRTVTQLSLHLSILVKQFSDTRLLL